jgi:hypothetical protein
MMILPVLLTYTTYAIGEGLSSIQLILTVGCFLFILVLFEQ